MPEKWGLLAEMKKTRAACKRTLSDLAKERAFFTDLDEYAHKSGKQGCMRTEIEARKSDLDIRHKKRGSD